MTIRNNWALEELEELYNLPLFVLIHKAGCVHAKHHNFEEIQICKLISVKTGGCSEDCKYCAQSSRNQTDITTQTILSFDEVVGEAKKAIDNGATRVCLGSGQREVRNNKHFNEVLKMIRAITDMGAEVCCTLGMLNEIQAAQLKEAGLFAYNHNLDSSEKFYKTIITTRSYQERLDTLDVVEKQKMELCCGGIIGMGEMVEDRLELLLRLANRDPHPQSVPINKLVPIPGTPLEDHPPLSTWEMVRMVATTRIALPETMVRLSAGRETMTREAQALCFMAGANSIFYGEKLLTVGNTPARDDDQMFELFNLKKRAPFKTSAYATAQG